MTASNETEQRSCVKCGGFDINVRWHRDKRACSEGRMYGDRDYVVSVFEHLHMNCRTCQFKWTEKTKDHNGA